MPGTHQRVEEIISNKSGKIPRKDFGVVSNPEFLREGSALADFLNPPYTIVASNSEKALVKTKVLYSFVDAPFVEVDISIAEIIKFLNNSFHALKVAFGNEIGRICKLDIDSHDLMGLFVKILL